MYPAQTLKGFWQHQVRWARTVRMVRPASFVGLVFTHGLPWCVLAAVAAPSLCVGAGYLAAYLVLRLLMAWVVGVWGVGDNVLRKKLWLVSVRDAIYFAVWVAGFVSNRVIWGGAEFAIEDGKMRQLEKGSREKHV
jgi:ceramide glucosyltransferase